MTKMIPWASGALVLALVQPLHANPSPKAPAPAAPPAAATSPTPPTLRLGDSARPTRYAAELTVVPDQEQFQGSIDIELTVRDAQVGAMAQCQRADDKPRRDRGQPRQASGNADCGAEGFRRYPLPERAFSGPSSCTLSTPARYRAKRTLARCVIKKAACGTRPRTLSPSMPGGCSPALTSRRSRSPGRLTLKVPSADQAFTNTPVVRESDAGGGLRKVEFAPTKPLPSYLVAWAVGPFEIVPAGKSAHSGTPVRIITARGQQAQASWAAQCSAQVLAELENYFGINYPYDKLDVITVPMLGGAMENPGLVTFDQTLLLNSTERDTIQRKRAYAEVAAHEFAHQWFGDLVTTAWWDESGSMKPSPPG